MFTQQSCIGVLFLDSHICILVKNNNVSLLHVFGTNCYSVNIHNYSDKIHCITIALIIEGIIFFFVQYFNYFSLSSPQLCFISVLN